MTDREIFRDALMAMEHALLWLGDEEPLPGCVEDLRKAISQVSDRLQIPDNVFNKSVVARMATQMGWTPPVGEKND